MIDIAKGRYWGLPWSLVDGCTPCSPGCEHCWAAAMTKRFRKVDWTHGPGNGYCAFDGRAVRIMKRDYSHFNGEILTHSERLSIPLKRRKPTVYAVWNDLFHEDVPFGFIHEVFGTMRQTPQHVYLVLTKRPEWMQEAVTLVKNLEILGWANGFYSHVFYGLTVCNQQEADEKIPVFLQVQGKKFLSIEPMLGAMKLFYGHSTHVNNLKNISALILGGETGPGARPMHPDWVRSVRDQCAAAGVPFYFKQGLKGKTNWTTSDVAQWGNGEVINKMLDGITLKTPFYRYIDGCTHDELPWVTP